MLNMNKKIKLSRLSKSLRNEVRKYLHEGRAKLSNMPPHLKTKVLKEVDELDGQMANSEEVYYQAGAACAKAVKQRDQARANRQQAWFNRALALEKGANKAKAQAAFDRGYGSSKDVAPTYFRENAINETGEWDEGDENMVAWKQKLESDLRSIEDITDGKLKFISSHGFDAYQGPYAQVRINGRTYKVWTVNDGNPDDLWIEGYPLDNTSGDGKLKGFQGTMDDIIDMLAGPSMPGFSLNETGKGDEAYIDAQLLPVLADESKYGYSLKIQSPNAKANWMTINRQQLIGIIDILKRG